MPQVCSKSAVQPVRRRAKRGTTPNGSAKRALRAPPIRASAEAPSPTIADTCTTHKEMLDWVAWFARFHTEEPPYVPYEIKTIDCPVVRADGSPVLRSDGQPQMMRCVREVARSEIGDRVEWKMISWNVGQPGATFEPCASLGDAITAFNTPPNPVLRP